MIETITKSFNISRGSIFKRSKGNQYRNLAIYLLKKYTALNLTEIGSMFGIDYTSVSIAANRFERKAADDKKLQRMLRDVQKSLLSKGKGRRKE